MLQKRLNNGFNGFEVPPIPRAPRSARRRLPCRKRADDDQLCAFNLLATVAGKLLEGENTAGATELWTGENRSDIGKDVNKNILVEEDPGKGHATKQGDKEVSHVQNDVCSPLPSVITTSDVSEATTAKLVGDGSKIEHGEFSNVDAEHFHSTISSSRSDVKYNNCVEIGPSMHGINPISATADTCCIEDVYVQDVKSHALGNSDNSVKLPVETSVLDEGSRMALLRDHSPCGSLPICRNNVKLVVRDDDENSSGCTPPRKLNKVFRPPVRIGDRRIKRLLASRYWKATPQSSSQNCFNAGSETSVYHSRANSYKRQRSLRDHSLKRRRLYDRRYATNAYGNASGSVATMHEADGASHFAASLQNCFQTNDSHVKLKIKSFRVPELFFEIPETATVGSLKRTVMEAVSAVLGGGLRVGVLVQGKKIRDDNITLVQTGIYNNNKNDALGFILEPVSSQVPPTQCPEDHSYIPPPQLTRCPYPSITVKQGVSGVSPDLPATDTDCIVESDYDSAPSPLDMSIDKCLTDSKALVGGAEMNVDELSAVPMQKSKRKDAGQRRIRRPFSVSEVEALVQAVEELGTGRWRDVKMRAFDNAKHRTYVDLKDKWKTLVHTARISPQQRRGEPVPQDLLDRVLTAHAFWSEQQQPKQHTETCLLF